MKGFNALDNVFLGRKISLGDEIDVAFFSYVEFAPEFIEKNVSGSARGFDGEIKHCWNLNQSRLA